MASIYRVRTAWSGPTGALLSTLWFENSAGLTAQAAADAVHALWDGCKAMISNTFTAVTDAEVATFDVSSGQITAVTSVTNTPVTGTESAEYLPFQTQGLIRLPTGIFLAGRRLQGHVYVPGPTENRNDAGTPSVAYQAALTAAGAAMVSWVSSTPVVYSRTHTAAVPITTPQASPHWAVLRSRR